MVGAVADSPIDSLIKKNSQMAASQGDGTRIPLSNVYPKVAVRYLLHKSKRFNEDLNSSPMEHDQEDDQEKRKRVEDNGYSKERLLERLRYLGLAPRKYCPVERSSSSKRKRNPPKKLPQALGADDEFVQPQVLECDFCPKIFFNKMVHRRHTIKHLRIRRCNNCNQPFKEKISHRRHQANCKQKLHYKNYARRIY